MRIIENNLIFNRPHVPRETTTRIIIHHTGGGDVPASIIHRWHLARKGFGGIGYHYLIRADGTVERGRPENVRGVHVSKANGNSIGIALSGNFTLRPPTAAQLTALVQLIRDIRERYQNLAMTAEDRRLIGNLRADIQRVQLRADDPVVRAWFEKEHNGIDAYLAVQRTRLSTALARTPVLSIAGHSDVGATACPGGLFPWTELRQRLV